MLNKKKKTRKESNQNSVSPPIFFFPPFKFDGRVGSIHISYIPSFDLPCPSAQEDYSSLYVILTSNSTYFGGV